jgi:hypothetical protein
MATNRDIEAYFDELELNYETVGEGIWVLNLEDQGVDNLVINHETPIIVLRIKLMDAPKKKREQFFQRLLELNLTDLAHGAYALEENNVVLVDTLQSEYLDLNELQASIESLAFAAVQNYEELSSYR